MISITNITKTYQMEGVEVKALRGVDFSVETGEFVAIVGPSGSGKSTLMNIIGCLDIPSSGEYSLNGNKVSSLSGDQLAEARNKQIGFIFQSFNLLPRFTALDNVMRPLIYRGMKRRERFERAMKALEQVGLGDRVHHRPTQLSGGQQQRVAIARALVGDPDIILADEPTGNLDSISGKDVMKMLNELHESGKTIVLITHDLEVAKLAGRQVSIFDGQIVS